MRSGKGNGYKPGPLPAFLPIQIMLQAFFPFLPHKTVDMAALLLLPRSAKNQAGIAAFPPVNPLFFQKIKIGRDFFRDPERGMPVHNYFKIVAVGDPGMCEMLLSPRCRPISCLLKSGHKGGFLLRQSGDIGGASAYRGIFSGGNRSTGRNTGRI